MKKGVDEPPAHITQLGGSTEESVETGGIPIRGTVVGEGTYIQVSLAPQYRCKGGFLTKPRSACYIRLRIEPGERAHHELLDLRLRGVGSGCDTHFGDPDIVLGKAGVDGLDE